MNKNSSGQGDIAWYTNRRKFPTDGDFALCKNIYDRYTTNYNRFATYPGKSKKVRDLQMQLIRCESGTDSIVWMIEETCKCRSIGRIFV